MRSAIGASLILAVAAGCIGPGNDPPAVQPTLAGLETLGLDCGNATKDNVPSGLFQWSCAGAIESRRATVLVDGNADGVAGITLVVDVPGDPVGARSRFGRLVDVVPPLSTAPVLKDTVAGWTGEQTTWTVAGVRIYAECAAPHCIFTVSPAVDALRPLPLP